MRRDPAYYSVFGLWMVIAALLAAAVGAATQGHWRVATALAAIGAVGGFSRHWAGRCARRVHGRIEVAQLEAYPGERTGVHLVAKNTGRLPAWLDLDVQIGETALAQTRMVALGGSTKTWDAAIEVPARGVYRVTIAAAWASDPLGLVRFPIEISGHSELRVFPRLGAAVQLSGAHTRGFGNRRSTGPIEDPVFWIGTREYEGTQPARAIHWPATARRGTLQARVWEPSEDRHYRLLLDAASYQGSPIAFERAIESLAGTAAGLSHNGCAISLVTDAVVDAPPAVSGRALHDLLGTLAGVRLESARPIPAAVAAAAPVTAHELVWVVFARTVPSYLNELRPRAAWVGENGDARSVG